MLIPILASVSWGLAGKFYSVRITARGKKKA